MFMLVARKLYLFCKDQCYYSLENNNNLKLKKKKEEKTNNAFIPHNTINMNVMG